MKKQKIILIGGGGHCLSSIDLINSTGNFVIEGIVDNNRNIQIEGYPLLGTDEDLESLAKLCDCFAITIGQLKSAAIRKSVFEKLKRMNVSLPVIISPRAYVSKSAIVGEGSMIFHDAVVNAGASIGLNCIVNTKALIEHGVRIGNHSHISTAAVVNGDVRIGEECFIGSNAVIKNGLSLQQNVVVGMGAVVISNVEAGKTVVGNPAK